ncbi:MAG: hypothetical protein F6K58_31455 [Symploca sp. SIO2E9]|nr:hypothetical protein [Symploca sp. SIO2E9]
MFSLIKGKKTPEDTSSAPKVKKEKGFFMQLDETENVAPETPAPKAEPAQPAVATTEAPKAEPEPKKAKPKFGLLKNLGGGKKSPEDASTAPKAKKEQDFFLDVDQTGNVASQTPAPKPESVSKKAKKKKSVKAEVASTEEKKVAPPVASAAAKNGKVEPQAGLTFAPNYLLPTPRSRRRPGPSMDMFRDMARQAKTPIQ